MSFADSTRAQTLLALARDALRQNRRLEAYDLAKRAAEADPQLEGAWLILAALSGAQESIQFLSKALKINPNSDTARKGMHWAVQRLRESQRVAAADVEATQRIERSTTAEPEHTQPVHTLRDEPTPQTTQPVILAAAPATQPRRKTSPWFVAAVLSGALILTAVAGLILLPNIQDVMAHNPAVSRPEGALLKPSLTPTATFTFTPTITFTATPTPTETPTETPIPTETPTETAAVPTDALAGIGGDEAWIDVNLSEQMVYAYRGSELVSSFLVSTGAWNYPTVTGQYNIYVKYEYTDMSGPGYYLADVPYTMYFYKGYGLHGTYWHNNFGTPMSHGCVNLRTEDAQWLFNFASVGTLVNVHY